MYNVPIESESTHMLHNNNMDIFNVIEYSILFACKIVPEIIFCAN